MNVFQIGTVGLSICLFAFACTGKKGKSQEDSSDVNAAAAVAKTVAGTVAGNVNFGMDPISIARYVDEKNKNASDAVAIVQGLGNDTYWALNVGARKKNIRGYNIAVCKLSNRCELKADEGTNYYYSSHTIGTTTYGVWGFRGGTFVNHGSGGWDNWFLKGCHNHTPGMGAVPVRFEVCSQY